MTRTDQYAVFGHPINHSKSPTIHQQFAIQTQQNIEYSRQDVNADQFVATTRNFFEQGGCGLNCTVPLKQRAWQFADTLTQRASFSKAVNTLTRQADGSIVGDNTDGVGLVTDLLSNHQIQLKSLNILLLGAGGASRGILAPILQQYPNKLVIANRTAEKAITLANEFKDLGSISGCGYEELRPQFFDVILNATSASLSGEIPPLPDTLFEENGICYDLAYSDEPTAFVRWGQQHGAAKSLDGLGMLVEQAAEAFYIWRDLRPKTQAVISALDSVRNR